jgi:RNA polymerase sigma-70 factor (ECF subfamily)
MQDEEYPGAQLKLSKFLEEDSTSLLPTLCFYIQCAGLSVNRIDAEEVAQDLLNDVAVEVLTNVDRFRPDSQPKAWVLGIAANLIKRRQAQRSKRINREPLITDMHSNAEVILSEEELFDQFVAWSQTDPGHQLEAEEAINSLLNDLSKDDQQLLRSAIVQGMDGKSLAKSLGITPGAARVRLHRALNRVRQSHTAEMMREFHG